MTKYLIILSLLFVSCSQKEKTYEELEAKILCDVLPEIISVIDGGGPIVYENSKGFKGNKISKEKIEIISTQIDSIKKKIVSNEYSIGIFDTLYKIEHQHILNEYKVALNNFKPIKYRLENRKINTNELSKSILKVDYYNSTLMPPFKIYPKPKESQFIYMISRVIIEKNKKNAIVILSRGLQGITVYVHFKKNKWRINKFLI